ncbi:response regulator [Vibrio gallicus]|uniref:response regulator n=1 Tax=Vibrio gallicus TaxID=190897 RepID=UPI0021C3C5C1|nr:response regulator [Vibrio gallicus]
MDSFSRQGMIYLQRNLVQGSGIEAVPIGTLRLYSTLGLGAAFDESYVPPLSVFESLSDSDFNQIKQIYQLFGANTSEASFTQHELNWIAENPVIKVGIDPAALPYEGIKDGEFKGIIADILQELTTITNIKFEPVLVDSWQQTVELIRQRKIDMVSAAIENKSLGGDYTSSQPIFTDQLAIVGHIDQDYGQGLGSMSGMRIGVQQGASNTPNLLDGFPDINWVELENSEKGLSLLNDRKLDAYIDTTYVTNYILNEHAYRDLVIVDRLSNTVSPTFHILKNEPVLNSIITKAIRVINPSKKQQIINNWATNRVIEKVDYTIVLLVVGFSLLVLIIVLISNLRLKKQVAATIRAEQEALASRNQLFDILNTSSIAVMIVQQGRVKFTNKHAQQQFGISHQDQDGIKTKLLYMDLSERTEIYRLLSQQGKVIDREVEFQTLAGARFTALCSYFEMEYEEKPAVLFWSYDISEIKQLNSELATAMQQANIANQTKSDFLANMSHEIRTPMNAIIGMSHLALQQSLEIKAYNYIEKVHQSAQSLLLIINDILDISKIESGKFELEKRPFSLRDTLHSIADVLSFKLTEKKLEFLFCIDNDVPRMVIGDELRLSQLLINLGNNATKFTHQGHVIVGIDGRYRSCDNTHFVYHFYVKDTGIGIAPDKIDSLFNSFQQADASTTREYGGTGLGLSICKQIIELMGGKIWVESELGSGAVFHFEVEMEVASSRSNLFSDLQPEFERLSNRSVLLLESDAFAIEALGMALKGTAINTRFFTDVQSLINELTAVEETPVCYVSDTALTPHLSKQQLLHIHARADLVLCTTSDTLTEFATGAGIQVLQRPWLPFDLISVISGGKSASTGFAKSDSEVINKLHGQKILLVEDNEFNQELVVGLLQPYGVDIDIAENGQQAIDKARQHHYQLILMDIQMPVLSGYEATQYIREFDPSTPIVAMTANVMVEHQQWAAEVGMNDFITKPIDINRLLQIMTKIVGDESALEYQHVISDSTTSDKVIFDKQLGLFNCGDDLALYLKLLKKFSANSDSRQQVLAAAVQRDECELVARELHTLKGVAASIGATALAELCMGYEQQAQQQSKLITMQDVSTIHQAHSLVVKAITSYVTQHATTLEPTVQVATSDTLSQCDLNDDLQLLRQLLENYDIGAVEHIQHIKQLTTDTDALAQLTNIEQALNSYQFEQATELLMAWQQ